jgi:hypothetical protein
MEKPLDEVIKSVRGVPVGHMTKAERKRLQWEQERGENEYSRTVIAMNSIFMSDFCRILNYVHI